jgi:hypothetical protein
MKEVQLHNQDKIEISKPVEQQMKFAFLGSLRKKPNLIVFEASLLTGDVVPAKMELTITASGKNVHTVKVKEDHIYCYALNGKNAVRKFERMLHGRAR